MDALRVELEALDQMVADEVRVTVQEICRAEPDDELYRQWPDLPDDPTSTDGLIQTTLMVEIPACQQQVLQPALTAPGAPFESSTWPSPTQRQLLTTTGLGDRPGLDQLRWAATRLADAITLHGDDPGRAIQYDDDSMGPVNQDPTGLFPTEIRIVHQELRRRLGRPIDLYLMFN
jgi:hypothetical protein